MRLSEFLKSVHTSDLLFKDKILLFKGTQHPLIFFSFFVQRLKSLLDIEVQSLDLSTEPEAVIKSKLETSFLGLKTFYWLHDIGSLKAKPRAQWMQYLKKYAGPNIVAFFAGSAVRATFKEGATIIQVDDAVDKRNFLLLVKFLDWPLSKSFEKVIDTLFRAHPHLPLDQACMLMHYALLIGGGYKEFEKFWLDKIVVPQKSLFTLSQYFFDKNPKRFFELWSKISGDYPEQFWIVFWSEQLWRACNVVKFLKKRDFAQAKSVSFRLPFSFLQRSWRKFSQLELQNAHEFIYSIDYSLKNGGKPFSLDLFYSRFLNNQFC